VPGLLALKASVELLAGAGVGAVSRRIKELTERLVEGLRAKGFSIVSPRSGEQWSGIVSFVANDPAKHAGISKSLRTEHRTEIALREGRLRVSPHFYNTDEQIDRLIHHLPPGGGRAEI
jgi:selenocysteine lyase/cysteine desulfurase